MSKREMKEWLASIDAELAENEPVLYKWSQDDSLLTFHRDCINFYKQIRADGWKEVFFYTLLFLFAATMGGFGVQGFSDIVFGIDSADLTPLGMLWFLVKGTIAAYIAVAVMTKVIMGKAHHFRITEKGIHHVTWENYPELGHMMVKLILLISMPIVIIIAIIGGPMVFVGAGGAALGVFGIYASMSERAKRHDFAAWEDDTRVRDVIYIDADDKNQITTEIWFDEIEFDIKNVMSVNELIVFINQHRTKPIEIIN